MHATFYVGVGVQIEVLPLRQQVLFAAERSHVAAPELCDRR